MTKPKPKPIDPWAIPGDEWDWSGDRVEELLFAIYDRWRMDLQGKPGGMVRRIADAQLTIAMLVDPRLIPLLSWLDHEGADPQDVIAELCKAALSGEAVRGKHGFERGDRGRMGPDAHDEKERVGE